CSATSPPDGSRATTARRSTILITGPACRPGARDWHRPRERVEEGTGLVRGTLPPAPLEDLSDVHLSATGDLAGDRQALSIVPMIKSGQAVPAGIRRGKSLHSDPPDSERHRSDVEVGTDSERPRREFHEIARPRMDVLIPLSSEADRGHRRV